MVGGEPDDLIGGELDLVGGELDQVESMWGRTRWGRTRQGANSPWGETGSYHENGETGLSMIGYLFGNRSNEQQKKNMIISNDI